MWPKKGMITQIYVIAILREHLNLNNGNCLIVNCLIVNALYIPVRACVKISNNKYIPLVRIIHCKVSRFNNNPRSRLEEKWGEEGRSVWKMTGLRINRGYFNVTSGTCAKLKFAVCTCCGARAKCRCRWIRYTGTRFAVVCAHLRECA